MKKSLITLAQWYQSPTGVQVCHSLDEYLKPIMPSFFGYHCLQIGPGVEPDCINHTIINHKIYQTPTLVSDSSIVSSEFTLPYPDGSIDLIVVPHMLEITQHTDVFLRELHRVLIDQGRIIIIGFNPLSLCGVSSLFYRCRRDKWIGRWRTPYGLSVLLEDHDFKMIHYDSIFYRPICATKKWLNRLLWIETLGRFTSLFPGGIYIATVRKHVATVTPIRAIFQFKRFVLGRAVPELSSAHHCENEKNH